MKYNFKRAELNYLASRFWPAGRMFGISDLTDLFKLWSSDGSIDSVVLVYPYLQEYWSSFHYPQKVSILINKRKSSLACVTGNGTSLTYQNLTDPFMSCEHQPEEGGDSITKVICYD